MGTFERTMGASNHAATIGSPRSVAARPVSFQSAAGNVTSPSVSTSRDAEADVALNATETSLPRRVVVTSKTPSRGPA